jgi:hypothetical protein
MGIAIFPTSGENNCCKRLFKAGRKQGLKDGFNILPLCEYSTKVDVQTGQN